MSEKLPPGNAPDSTPEVKPDQHVAPEIPASAPSNPAPQPVLPPEPLVTVAPIVDGDEPAPEIVPGPTPEEAAPLQEPITAEKAKKTAETVQPVETAEVKPAAPRPRAEHYTLMTIASALRALSVTFAAAVIVATIFMEFTSPDFLSARTRNELGVVAATAQRSQETPTTIPTVSWGRRVGVIAGHSGIATYGPTKGNTDPGNVCPDGFTEESVTMRVAQQVVAELQGRGYTADLLEEFDPRLDNYQAAAFISLHADVCTNFDDGYNHSGFKVTYPVERLTVRDQDMRLNDCIRDNYGAVTGLPFTPNGITENMTNYHAFHLYDNHPGIASTTPAVILELGLLGYDRQLLQNHPEIAARGVINGLLCFLDPKDNPVVSPVAPATIAPLLSGTPIGIPATNTPSALNAP